MIAINLKQWPRGIRINLFNSDFLILKKISIYHSKKIPVRLYLKIRSITNWQLERKHVLFTRNGYHRLLDVHIGAGIEMQLYEEDNERLKTRKLAEISWRNKVEVVHGGLSNLGFPIWSTIQPWHDYVSKWKGYMFIGPCTQDISAPHVMYFTVFLFSFSFFFLGTRGGCGGWVSMCIIITC